MSKAPQTASYPKAGHREYRIRQDERLYIRQESDGTMTLVLGYDPVSPTEIFRESVLKDRDPLVQAAVSEFFEALETAELVKVLRENSL